MVHFNLFTDSNVLLFTYMFLYNISLISLFWVLLSTITTKFKTLHSFNSFSFNSFYLTTLTIVLFSMAGVPPFIGFFSKLFILTLLSGSEFALLYTLFFVVLFIGLYFYIQNVRFLHSTNHSSFSVPTLEGLERVTLPFFYTTVFILTLLILGTVYVDDILLVFTWLLY